MNMPPEKEDAILKFLTGMTVAMVALIILSLIGTHP
jgi:hypothetical protein